MPKFAALPPEAKEIACKLTHAMLGYQQKDGKLYTVTLTNASDSKGGSFNGSAFFSLSFVSFTSVVAATTVYKYGHDKLLITMMLHNRPFPIY